MVAFITNESSEDAFTLTASQPWHLDPSNYIVLSQQTQIQAFTAAQNSGLTFWALDQTNEQHFLNGQAFQGYILNPNGQTGLSNIVVPAGQWWLGVNYSGTLSGGQAISGFDEVSTVSLPGGTFIGNVPMAVGGNAGTWKSQGFTITGNPSVYIETEGSGGIFMVQTDAQFQAFQSAYPNGFSGGSYSFLYALGGNSGGPAIEIEGTAQLPPGHYNLTWVNTSNSWAGGAADISGFDAQNNSGSLNSSNSPPPITPTVLSISAISDLQTTEVITGHVLTITVNLNEAVTVTGKPTLQLNDNEVATYASGSGANSLTFTFTAQASDNIVDLQVTGLNFPSGASIIDQSGNKLTGSVTGDLSIQVNTTTVQQEILGLYAALYGRAAEFPGYSYWVGIVGQQSDGTGVTITNAGSTAVMLNDAQVLGQAFVNTQATFFNQIYASLADSAFINALYVNIGGNAGDPGGIVYWANILGQSEAGGQSVQAARASLVGQFVHDLVDYNLSTATGLTAAQLLSATQRQETIDNKIAVSLAYSTASQQAGGNILVVQTVNDAAFQAATTIIETVTYDPATVTAAILGINNAVAHQNLALI